MINIQLNPKKIALIVILFCMVSLLLFTTNKFKNDSKTEMLYQQELLQFTKSTIKKINQKKKSNIKKTMLTEKIQTSLNNYAKDNNLTIQRMQNFDDRKISLWLSEQKFDGILNFIFSLNNYDNISIEDLSLSSTNKPGFVNLKMTLKTLNNKL